MGCHALKGAMVRSRTQDIHLKSTPVIIVERTEKRLNVMIMAEIREDSLVRYKGTGTVGKVKVLKDEDGEKWALLDSTMLYYRTDALEPIDYIPERKELEGMTMEQIQERFKAQQEIMDKAKMQDESLEAGG